MHTLVDKPTHTRKLPRKNVSQKASKKPRKSILASTRRGDTIIEVLFSFVIFSFIVIVVVSMMNMGLSTSERSLELVVARNELNAQAEALRFIHSSYISELTLPTCDDPSRPTDAPCQKYSKLWGLIRDNAMRPSSASPNIGVEYSIPSPLAACKTVYEPLAGSSDNLLQKNKAFVINTRQLIPTSNIIDPGALTSAYISINSKPELFTEPTLGARILYTRTDTDEDSSSKYASLSLTNYDQIAKVEGIWVVAVAGTNDANPPYYDFYIETCWYGSGNASPSSLDAVIRLYNSEGT